MKFPQLAFSYFPSHILITILSCCSQFDEQCKYDQESSAMWTEVLIWQVSGFPGCPHCRLHCGPQARPHCCLHCCQHCRPQACPQSWPPNSLPTRQELSTTTRFSLSAVAVALEAMLTSLHINYLQMLYLLTEFTFVLGLADMVKSAYCGVAI